MVDVADLVNEAAPEGEVMDGCNSFVPRFSHNVSIFVNYNYITEFTDWCQIEGVPVPLPW